MYWHVLVEDVKFKTGEYGLAGHELVKIVAAHFGIINNGKIIRELSLEELRNESQEKIEIITSQATLAAAALEEDGICDYTLVNVDKIHVNGAVDKISDINKMLIRKGIEVSEIRVIGSSLESFYLSCVGNGGR